jgi:class 3 adenylate cyclase
MHQVRVDLLSQRLAMHLSQEVWQRLFHGPGRGGIVFTQAPLAVLFIESLPGEGERRGQERFFVALERLAREHGGTIDEFAWGGSLLFFGQPDEAVRTALALQYVVPEQRLRMGVHHGECLLARFRSGGISHATLLGEAAAEAAAVASASEYGSVGVSGAVKREWLELAGVSDRKAQWRCERKGNGSMRLVPTGPSQPAA